MKLDKLDPVLLIVVAVLITCIGLVIRVMPEGATAGSPFNPSPRYATVAQIPAMTVTIPLAGAYSFTGFPPGSTISGQLHSASPVDIGFLPDELVKVRPVPPVGALAQIGKCAHQQVLQTGITCTLPFDGDVRSWTFVIQDDRSAAGVAGAGLAAMFGIRRPADNYAVRNDVSVNVEAIACVANCPPAGR